MRPGWGGLVGCLVAALALAGCGLTAPRTSAAHAAVQQPLGSMSPAARNTSRPVGAAVAAPMSRALYPSISWGGALAASADNSGIFPIWPYDVTPQTVPLVTIKISNEFASAETVSYDLIVTSGTYSPADIPDFNLGVSVPYSGWPHGVWDYKRAEPGAPHMVQVQPGATVSVELSWPGRRLNGSPAPAGRYLAAVQLSGYLVSGPSTTGHFIGLPPSGQTAEGTFPYLIVLGR